MVKSGLSAFEADEDQQLKKITAQENEVLAIATLSDAELFNRIRDLEGPILRVADQAAMYTKSLEDLRYREILDWISLLRYIEHQRRHAERVVQGSGEWLLSSPEYLDWQTSSVSSIFLLYGTAGSGKTSLASVLLGLS